MTTYIEETANNYIVVTPTGDDSNGGVWGGQVSGNGVNRSMDDDAHVVIDGTTVTAEAVNRSTMKFTAGYTVSEDDLGNGVRLHIASGTKAGDYITGRITSVDTAAHKNEWGISSLHTPWNGIAAGTALTGAMGGALATPAEGCSRAERNAAVYVKAGEYTLTSNANNVPGGRPQVQWGTTLSAFKTTPGDQLANCDDRVILLRGTTTDNGALITHTGYNSFVSGFDVDCDDEWEHGIDVDLCVNCIVRNATGDGFDSSRNCHACAAYNCGGYGFKGGNYAECAAYDCANGFEVGNAHGAFRCLAHGCAGYGVYTGNYGDTTACVADECGTGFYTANRGMSGWNMATNCTTGGQEHMPGLAAGYNNTSNWYSTSVSGGIAVHLQLTAGHYEARTGTPPDFRINDTAGGGAELDEYAPKFAAGSIAGPQAQFAAIVKSTGGGGSGGGTTVPQGLHSIEAGINA